jgi:hypothetical protein
LINDTHSHCVSCWVNNRHIGNKDVIFTSHEKIGS